VKDKVFVEPDIQPPVPDTNRVCYLLLHLGVPSHFYVPLKTPLIAAKRAGKAIGIIIWPICLTSKDNKEVHVRYLFRFPYWRRDDKCAFRIGESFLFAVSAIFGPLTAFKEMVSVFRIPQLLVLDKKKLLIDELIQLEESRLDSERFIAIPDITFSTTMYISHFNVEAAWKITPILLKYEALYLAVRFLKSSINDFYVWPGEIDDVIYEPDLSARSGMEQSIFENALQNAFKAIEAVIGDPPKDDRKFFGKLNAIGLDPNTQVGYTCKLPLNKVIREMNMARDKKAAHGSTTKRRITTGELLEYQMCARTVVMAAIKTKLSISSI